MNGAIGSADYAIVVVYLLAMLGLGWAVASRIKGFRDYFLASGALTTPLLVCTLVSTYYELDVTFAVSESGYDYGLVSWLWLSRPYYVVIIVAALVLSTRLRKIEGMTLPDVLAHHYGPGAQMAGAAACFIYSLPITALAGMATLLEFLGWSAWEGLLIAMGICVTYTIVGGLWADAITDTVQFVLMCVSLAVALPIAVRWVGGWEFTQSLPEAHMTATGGLSPWLIAAWTVGALTVFVEPAFYQRIFAARSAASVRGALLIGILLWAGYDWGVTVIGMVARSAVAQGLLGEDLEGKRALLAVCMQTLPLGLKGLLLGGILAAAMSSVDTYCLLASGNMVYDIYRPLRARRGLPPLSDRAMVRLTRAGVFVVMLVGVGATLFFERITDAWVFMAGALVSVVFVPVLAAVLWRPSRAAGAWAAAGGLAALVLYHGLVHGAGSYDEDAESWVWRVGGMDLWREYAALAALPVSLAGLIAGHLLGKR